MSFGGEERERKKPTHTHKVSFGGEERHTHTHIHTHTGEGAELQELQVVLEENTKTEVRYSGNSSSSTLKPALSSRPQPLRYPSVHPNTSCCQRFRVWLHRVIFGADTRGGRAFDVVLLILIFLSVLQTILESVRSILSQREHFFFITEWVFTGIFTLEYVLRLFCISKPLNYAKSFFGVVDFVAIVPSYISLLLPDSDSARSLRVVRVFRLLRTFLILHLGSPYSLSLSLSLCASLSLSLTLCLPLSLSLFLYL